MSALIRHKLLILLRRESRFGAYYVVRVDCIIRNQTTSIVVEARRTTTCNIHESTKSYYFDRFFFLVYLYVIYMLVCLIDNELFYVDLVDLVDLERISCPNMVMGAI